MSLVLKGGDVYTGGKLVKTDILIENGRIAKIGNNLSGKTTQDVSGLTVLPGMIDAHVHFREPGHPKKEDFHSGSMAAAAGGVTLVLDMPNNDPPITTQKDLDDKRDLAEKSLVNYGLYIGATAENIEDLDDTDAIAIKVYHGSSTGSLLLEKVSDFARLMEHTGKLVVVHSENEELIKYFSDKYRSTEQHHQMRDNLAAAISTSEIVTVANYYNKRMHVAHMSTKEEVAILRAFKTEGITCEVSPHHLFLSSQFFMKQGNYGKMNPPLRSQEDQDALWQAINEGIVDIIATDHAPHTKKEKDVPFEQGPCGVPGVQTMLPLMLNAAHEGRLTLQDVVRLCAENPAKIFCIKDRGSITEGYHADLAIVDLNREETITDEQQFSRCGWTPFKGTEVTGWPVMTLVNGTIVYEDGKINEEGGGMEIELRD